MPVPVCHKCRKVIPIDDINVARDIALCRTCNLVHKLSDLAHRDELDPGLDLNNPPQGAWFRVAGMDISTGATHRSIGAAIGLLFFGLFWNGIVSVFVLLAISGTLAQLAVPAPEWFPAPKMNGGPMGLGMVLFLWIFLTPFIVIGVGVMAACLSSLWGRSEITISGSNGTIFTGIGSLGYRRRFNASTIKDLRIDESRWRDSDGDRRSQAAILLETKEGKIIKFGGSLTPERRKFVAAALRRCLKL